MKSKEENLDSNLIKINDKEMITIITIVLNDSKNIEKTILSTLKQNYKNINYIVIDGGSTDGTIEIINKYKEGIDLIISEPDEGIYDAMNKGIALASGKWINFMNSGDTFKDENIIKEIFDNNSYDEIDIIYGNWEIEKKDKKNKEVKAGKLNNLWKGSQFCHQATFINKDYHKKYKYNIKRNIVADFEFFYNSLNRDSKFHYIYKTICKIMDGGVSDTNRLRVVFGWYGVVKKNIYVNIYYSYRIIIEILKIMMKKTI